jgi:hypothetical protein
MLPSVDVRRLRSTPKRRETLTGALMTAARHWHSHGYRVAIADSVA